METFSFLSQLIIELGISKLLIFGQVNSIFFVNPKAFLYGDYNIIGLSYSNMSLRDAIMVNLRRILAVKHYFNAMSLYRSKFKNYLPVLINLKLKKYPIKVKLRNNEDKAVMNWGQLTPLLYDVDYDHKNDIVSLDRIGYRVKLFSAIENGELVPIFITKDYDFLKVKGKTVIDIGANIADSSIYFASEGAAHVIALEPYPQLMKFLMACKFQQILN